jgi:hypothetical protein
MHWLLVISAVLASWFALGWIAMNVVLWLFRRGLMPMVGPNTERLVRRILVSSTPHFHRIRRDSPSVNDYGRVRTLAQRTSGSFSPAELLNG